MTNETYRAIAQGLGNFDNGSIAKYLMEQAQTDKFPYTLKAALSEAASRIDKETWQIMFNRINPNRCSVCGLTDPTPVCQCGTYPYHHHEGAK